MEVTAVRVKVANRIYQMNRGAYRKLLTVASEQVPFGIYAAEKGDYAELMNQRCKSRRQLKETARGLREQGFRVYSNG